MTSAYIHEPSPLLQPELERTEAPGVDAAPSQSSRTRPRSSGCTVSKMLRPSGHAPLVYPNTCSLVGLVYFSSPSALITEITSEMFATSPLSRSSDAAHRVSASTRSVTSREFVTTPQHGGVVAVVGRHHLDPTEFAVGAAEPVADGLRRARSGQPVEHPGQRGAIFLEEAESAGISDPTEFDAEEPAHARAAIRDRPPAMIVTMSLEFCTSERKRTSLSRSASSARFVAHVGERPRRT